MEKKSIVKQSSYIKEKLKERFEKLGLSYTQIASMAAEYGQKNIQVCTISRYFSNDKNSLTEESIIFLCYRFGIPVTLLIGKPDRKFKVSIPDYNEKECIRNINTIFGANAKKKVADKPGVPEDSGKD